MNTEKDEKRNAHVLIFLVDIKKNMFVGFRVSFRVFCVYRVSVLP